MNHNQVRHCWWAPATVCAGAIVLIAFGALGATASAQTGSSYAPVATKVDFQKMVARMKAAKSDVMKRQAALLAERYDLADRQAAGVTMSAGKAVQGGVRVKLSSGMTWDKLGGMTAQEIRQQRVFPKGFLPLPHPNHPEGGMVFPQYHIDEMKRQEGRDLTRFDLDYDLPTHFLPEYPPPIYLTTRPDLGDVSQGKVVTIDNYYELFNGLLNPKQLEGLRLLVTPFAQQQFNQTADRRSVRPHRGVTCLDCHVNGHTNSATHLAGDVRPQQFRHGLDTPTLRGVNIQRLFGSQCYPQKHSGLSCATSRQSTCVRAVTRKTLARIGDGARAERFLRRRCRKRDSILSRPGADSFKVTSIGNENYARCAALAVSWRSRSGQKLSRT